MMTSSRNGEFRCVIPGCPQVWRKASCREDRALSEEIARSQAAAAGDAGSAGASAQGYTQV